MRSTFAALLLFLSAGSQAAGAEPPQSANEWFQGNRIVVKSTQPPGKDFSSVTMLTAANGDSEIQTSGTSEGRQFSGTLMIVSGSRMLASGLPISPGSEIDTLDIPVLQVQIALKLLARAFPGGPRSIHGETPINVSETVKPLEVATPSASGAFPPPWSISGKATETSGRISFVLAFSIQGQEQPLTISGTWERLTTAPAFPDSQPIAGWRVFALGPYSRTDPAGGTIYDYGAQEITTGFKILGEVRADAKRRTGAGPRLQ